MSPADPSPPGSSRSPPPTAAGAQWCRRARRRASRQRPQEGQPARSRSAPSSRPPTSSSAAQHSRVMEIDASGEPLTERLVGPWVDRTPENVVFDIRAHRLLTHHAAPIESIAPEVRDTLTPALRERRQLYAEDLPRARSTPRSTASSRRSRRCASSASSAPSSSRSLRTSRRARVRSTTSSGSGAGAATCRWRSSSATATGWRASNATRRWQFLTEHQLGYVCVDVPSGFDSSLPPLSVATTDTAYVRFHGRNTGAWERGADTGDDRFPYDYKDADLEPWVPRLEKLAGAAKSVHVTFSGRTTDAAVRNARLLVRVLSGEPAPRAPPAPSGAAPDGAAPPRSRSTPGFRTTVHGVDRRLTTSLLVAAIASAGAGMVHAAAAGSHGDDAAVGVAVLGLRASRSWGGRSWSSPGRPVPCSSLGGRAQRGVRRRRGRCHARSASSVRSTAVEEVGAQDLVAAALAACATASPRCSRSGPRVRRADSIGRSSSRSASCVVAVTVPAMAAGHGHSDDDAAHQHDAAPLPRPVEPLPLGDARAAADGRRSRRVDDSRRSSRSPTPASPTVSGRGRPSCSVSTRVALLRRSSPTASTSRPRATRWIGDGRRVGGYLHFVQPGVPRPTVTSSIRSTSSRSCCNARPTVRSRSSPPCTSSTRGTTLADAPDIAGSLTPWHDHQNLCWDATGTKLAGIVVDGQCRPGGTFRATAPMMHVWLTDPPCGPFSGVEGHGAADCAHTHAPA